MEASLYEKHAHKIFDDEYHLGSKKNKFGEIT